MNIQKSTLNTLVVRVAASILGFVSIVVFARELTASELGIFFLFEMLIGFLAIPGSFGRGKALIKRVSEKSESGDIVATAVILWLFSSLVIIGGIYFARNYINGYVGASISYLLAIGISLRLSSSLPKNILKGELRVGESESLSLVQKLTWFSASVGLIWLGYGFYSLIYGLLVSYLLTTILGLYKISIPIGFPTWKSAKSLFNYWKYVIFSFLDSNIYNWADIAIIGLFLTQADVGIYEVAWRISFAVILASIAIEQTLLPQISSWDSVNSTELIRQILPGALLGSLFIVIPAFFGTILLSEAILRIIFGAEYANGWLVLVILMGGKIVEASDRILKTFVEGINLPNLRMRAVTVSIILNIVLNLILIWQYGIVGAAIATTFAFLASTLITLYYVKQSIRLQLPVTEIGWCIIASIAMYAILANIPDIEKLTSVAQLFFIVVLGAVIYLGITLSHPSIRTKISYNLSMLYKQ